MERCIAAALACCLFASAGGTVAADGPTIALGGGMHYSQGDYGTGTTTRITSFVVNGRYDSGPWTFRLAVPYLFISGSRAVVPGVGRVRGDGFLESTDSGLGDVVVSGTYAAHYDPSLRFGLDLTGRMKIATADPDEGLGTGEHDFGFQVDAYKGFDRITLFAGLGYTMFGSTPAFPLDDVFNYTVGVSYRVDDRDSAGLSYDERERVTPTAAPQRELTAFWSRRIEGGWRAQLYFLIGLAKGSPDLGLGASAAYAF
jgi:hypothetical protein